MTVSSIHIGFCPLPELLNGFPSNHSDMAPGLSFHSMLAFEIKEATHLATEFFHVTLIVNFRTLTRSFRTCPGTLPWHTVILASIVFLCALLLGFSLTTDCPGTQPPREPV